MMTRRMLMVALFAALPGLAGAADVTIASPWARPTVPGQMAGGAFLTLTSAGGDRLVGGSTPVAQRVELHVMKMEGDTMRMRQVEAIELPPGQAVKLQPGGLHVMFMGLKTPMKAGDTVPLTLKFERAGEVKVNVPVSAKAP